MAFSSFLIRAWRGVEEACTSTLSVRPASSRLAEPPLLVRGAPPPESSAVVYQVRLSRFREWASSVIPVAVGFLTAELLRAAPSLEILLPVAALGVLEAIIVSFRPGRTIIVTADTLVVPWRWSGSVTLRLSDIDREATIHPSRWHIINASRTVYARDGSHISLNALAIGRSNVERILKLIAA